jgi:6-phosphofructokinase
MHVIEEIITFLEQNKYFDNIQICSACIYIATLNLRLSKLGYIQRTTCPTNCSTFYLDNLKKCLNELKKKKSKIYFYYPEFQKIFQHKTTVNLFFDQTNDIYKYYI